MLKSAVWKLQHGCGWRVNDARCVAPLAILDLGAGSTDAAIINNDGAVRRCRRAGNIRGTEGSRNAVATGLVLAGEAKICRKIAAKAFSRG